MQYTNNTLLILALHSHDASGDNDMLLCAT